MTFAAPRHLAGRVFGLAGALVTFTAGRSMLRDSVLNALGRERAVSIVETLTSFTKG